MIESVPRENSPLTVKVAFDTPARRTLSPLNIRRSDQPYSNTPTSSPFHYRPMPLNRYTSDSSKNMADELNDNISLQVQRHHYGRPITPDSVMLNTINAPKEPSRNANIHTTVKGIRVVHGTRQTLYSCKNPVPISQLLNYSEYKKSQAAITIQAYVRRFLIMKKYKKEEQMRLQEYYLFRSSLHQKLPKELSKINKFKREDLLDTIKNEIDMDVKYVIDPRIIIDDKIPSLKVLFNFCDINHDGYLTIHDLSIFIKYILKCGYSKKEIANIIFMCDSTNRKLLNFTMFQWWFTNDFLHRKGESTLEKMRKMLISFKSSFSSKLDVYYESYYQHVYLKKEFHRLLKEYKEEHPPRFKCKYCSYCNPNPMEVAHHTVQCGWDRMNQVETNGEGEYVESEYSDDEDDYNYINEEIIYDDIDKA